MNPEPTVATDLAPTYEASPEGALSVRPRGGADSAIKLSIVIPTYSEAKNVAAMVSRLSSLLDGPLAEAYELIVVDDDSPDRTWEVASGLIATHPRLRVIRRIEERGLSTAVIRGWQASRGTVLGVIDGDLQHPPEVLLDLLREIDRGADLAVASRHVDGGGVSDWSVVRRLLSRGAQLLGLLLLPGVIGRVSDPMSGYFMLKRAAIENVAMQPLGYKILVEVLGRGSVKWIAEVPYVFRERLEGESKVTWKQSRDYLRHLVRLRLSRLPLERFLRFALVGASGVLVDMTILFLLSDAHTLAWGLTRSKVVASEIAIINNFVWNDAWTFGDVAKRQSAPGARLRRFAKFQLVCLAGLVLNVALLNVQYNYLGINRYVANAIAIALVTAWNFWLNIKLNWRSATR